MRWDRRAFLLALVAAIGCDQEDPDRLRRVGQKLAVKGQKLADEANLPKVTVTYPEAKGKKKAGEPRVTE